MLLLLVASAATIALSMSVSGIQLNEMNEMNNLGSTDQILSENAENEAEIEAEGAPSFSELDADALANKLDGEDEENLNLNEDEDLDQEQPDEEAEMGDVDPHSFLEGEEEDSEDGEDEEVDLSKLTDEDASEVLGLLNPEEQKAFREMLEEHRRGDNRNEL